MARPQMPTLNADVARRVIPLIVIGALVIAAVVSLTGGDDRKTITASFPRAISIYEGSDVRVIGVTVGTVDEVRPAGTSVEVTMSYDADVKLPADVKAAVIAPSVVGDRYVQLTPVYTEGAVAADNTTLDLSRTAIPLELDQIFQGIDDLAVGLGPDGANKDGALSRLLDSTARNFGGQGKQFNTTISNLSQLTSTLDNNKDELFGTAREIERFVKALADNDATVRDFNDSLSDAASLLEDERDDLSLALRNLGTAMTEVSTFVKENKDALSSNIKGLVNVSQILVNQRAALEETLDAAPVALANLFQTYNPSTGTLDTRANLGENIHALQTDPAAVLCSLVTTADPTGALCDALQTALPRTAPGEGGKNGSAGAGTGDVIEVERIDRSLAGILGVQP